MICQFDIFRFLSIVCWQHFVEVHAQGFNILHHPAYDPHGPHFYIYDDAIIDSSTASYVEAGLILNTIQALHIDGGKNSFNNMFVVGDQQLYDRMCVLVMRHREAENNITGPFHWTATGTLLRIVSVASMIFIFYLFLAQSLSNWGSGK